MATSTAPSSSTISFFSSSIFLSSQKPPTKLLSSAFKPPKSHPIIRSQLATLPILSFDGTQVGSTTLNLKSAPPDTARAVVHRGIVTDLRNKRRGTASTLTRGEVRGGGRKPYPQKKTGRARRGSLRTPLRPRGGVVFGPKPRDWSIKINKKEKRLAISTALDSALQNAIVVEEEFVEKFEKPRTRDFIELMKRWGIDPKEKSMFLFREVSDNVRLSSRNIGTLKMLTPRSLNLFDILNADKLVFTKGVVSYLNERYGCDYVGESEDDEVEEDEEVEGTEADANSDATD